MRAIQFQPEHLRRIKIQPRQSGFSFEGMGIEKYGEAMAANGPSWSLESDDGQIVACGGLFFQWEGRAVAWAFLSESSPMVALTRIAREILSACCIRRVEAWTDVDFPQAQRWIRMLGFSHEGRMASFSPDGHDMDLFSRVVI